MKHYIIYTMISWCLYEIIVGDIERMGRAINNPVKSRVITYT